MKRRDNQHSLIGERVNGAGHHQSIALNRHQATAFQTRAHRTHIEVEAGTVWLTVTGDGRDLVLRTGESANIDVSGRAVMEALDNAHVTVSEL